MYPSKGVTWLPRSSEHLSGAPLGRTVNHQASVWSHPCFNLFHINLDFLQKIIGRNNFYKTLKSLKTTVLGKGIDGLWIL